MKFKIFDEEWYPVLVLGKAKDSDSNTVDLTDEELNFINKSLEDFDKSQDILRNKINMEEFIKEINETRIYI